VIIVENPAELRQKVAEWKKSDKKIGFVPTMGYLHKGHLALMREAKIKSDRVIASIFVNPRQFGPNEDLEKYPRDLDRDSQMAEGEGIDVLFFPPEKVIYPEGYQTNISVSNLSKGLCGQSRPGHFDGVATIVTKLFNLVQPDIAVFGQKDYQQLALIRQLTLDLNFNIEIIGHPIVREQDGLAMSSRNRYLTTDDRASATCLYRVLQYSKNTIESEKEYPAELLTDEITEILSKVQGCTVDYIGLVHPISLQPVDKVKSGHVLAVAVYFNQSIRLIDNTTL